MLSWSVRRSWHDRAFLVASLAYPFIVYLGLDRLGPRTLAWGLIGLIGLKIASSGREPAGGCDPLWFGVFGMLGVILAIDEGSALLAYPILVNAGFALAFAVSLVRPPSAIERIARLSEPKLDAAGIVYTKRVTWLWLCFFLANGTTAWATARFASFEVWTLYNGFIAYLLIGALIGGEVVYRKFFRRAGRAV